MNPPSKRSKSVKPPPHSALLHDLPSRLAELEAEVRLYPSKPQSDRPLKAVEEPKDHAIEQRNVVLFRLFKNRYAVGRADIIFAGSNHARGVRHIFYYADDRMVLDIEGDYEDQQFGSNFRFQNVVTYHTGLWEKDLVKVSDQLRLYRARRREMFRKRRSA